MQARLFLLLILFLNITSFTYGRDEKQLRDLYQGAENAFQKQEYIEAKKAFEELLDKISVHSNLKYRVDWSTYVDICMRLARCCEELEQIEEGEKILELLVSQNPPDTCLQKIKLQKARISSKKKSCAEVYLEMATLSRQYPCEEWTAKDRALFSALEHSLNSYYDDLLWKAKRFIKAGSYEQGKNFYREILDGIEKGIYPKARIANGFLHKLVSYRLAETLLMTTERMNAHASSMNKKNEDKIDREMIYLCAMYHHKKKEFEHALEFIQKNEGLENNGILEHYNQAIFEIGNDLYQNGHYAQAKKYLVRVPSKMGNTGLLASVLLARIYLVDEKPKDAETILNDALKHLIPQNPLYYECHYLKGIAAYSSSDFTQAIKCFDIAIQQKKAYWLQEAAYYQGQSHLILAQKCFKKEQFLAHLIAARKCFTSSNNEAATLSLAQTFLLEGLSLKNTEALAKMEEILHASEQFSMEGKIHALLLLAQSMDRFEEKEVLLEQATSAAFEDTLLYVQSWHQRALNYVQQGLNDPPKQNEYFDLAISAFEKASHFICNLHGSLSFHGLRNDLSFSKQEKFPANSLEIFGKLLVFSEESFDTDQICYLKGLFAGQLYEPIYIAEAEKWLNKTICSYPWGKHAPKAIQNLATLYFKTGNYSKAEKFFLKLAKDYPESIFAPDALLWASEIAVLQNEDPKDIRGLICKLYPNSLSAAVAFFRQYDHSAYEEGEPEAMNHLSTFNQLFPNSHLQIFSNYFLLLHAVSMEEAQRAFSQATTAFQLYQKACKKLETILIDYHYATKLAIASRYLEDPQIADFLPCETLLIEILADFECANHPLTAKLTENDSYPPVYEKAEFFLAQCFLRQGRDSDAQKLLNQMLAHYNQAGIKQSFFLKQVWQEQGILALRCNDFNTAATCFELAQSDNEKSRSIKRS